MSAITHEVLNATLMDDAVLRASYFAELCSELDHLRRRHGDHPILLETEADFTEYPNRQRELYERAIRLAEHYGLPTLSIRVSLARILLEDWGDPAGALQELLACEPELHAIAAPDEAREWSELLANCEQSGRRGSA